MTEPIFTPEARLSPEVAFAQATAAVQAAASGGVSPVKVATVTLSSADILALSTKPITVVPAPGAGKIIYPIMPSFIVTGAGTGSYSDNVAGVYFRNDIGTDNLNFGNNVGLILFHSAAANPSGFDYMGSPVPMSHQLAPPWSGENQDLVATDTSDPTGDGTWGLSITVTYIVVDIPSI